MKSERRAALLTYGAAALVFALAIGVWLHEVVLHPGSRIAGPYSDGTSTIRDFWDVTAQHSTPFTFTHDALNGAPQGTDRAPAALLAASGVQTVFVWYARDAVGVVGAWNAFLLLGLFATAMATFALLHRLGCSFAASLFGGFVFGLGPYAVERTYAGHAGLAHNWVLVLVLAALLRLDARPTLAWAAAGGVAIGLAFWFSAYQGLLASLMTVVFAGVEVVRPAGARRLRRLALAAFAFLVAAATLAPIFALYLRNRGAVQAQLVHPRAELTGYAASLAAYLVPSERNPILHHLGGLGRWVLSFRPGGPTEGTLFVGYTTVALAVVAVVLLLRRDRRLLEPRPRRRASVFAAVLVPIAFLLSFPPSNDIAGLSVPGPSWVLGRLTSYYRVYARFGELVALGLVVLAGLALTALAARPGRLWRMLPIAALGLVALEIVPGFPATVDAKNRPAWDRWLAAAPRGTVVTYPSIGPGSGELNSRDLWFQHFDGQPRFAIAEGGSNLLESRNQAIRFLARDVTNPLTPRVLAAQQVSYAVLHDDVYRSAGNGPPHVDPRFYTLLGRFGDTRIFAVHAPPVNIAKALQANRHVITVLEGLAPPALDFVSGFNPAEPYKGSTGRWMAGDGVLRLRNDVGPMRVTLTGVAFSNAAPRVLSVVDGSGRLLARRQIPAFAERFALGPFAVSKGTSKLTLLTVPGPVPLGAGDPRTASVFLTSVAAEPLPAYAGT